MLEADGGMLQEPDRATTASRRSSNMVPSQATTPVTDEHTSKKWSQDGRISQQPQRRGLPPAPGRSAWLFLACPVGIRTCEECASPGHGAALARFLSPSN